MKFRFLFALVMLVLLTAGCASTVIGKDGNSYEALSRSQIERLITISRASIHDCLKKNLVSRVEFSDVMNNEPQVKIDYRGDRFGTAKIIWFTSYRKIEFTYEDDLTEEIIRKCSFSTSFIPPENRRIQPDKSIRGH